MMNRFVGFAFLGALAGGMLGYLEGLREGGSAVRTIPPAGMLVGALVGAFIASLLGLMRR